MSAAPNTLPKSAGPMVRCDSIRAAKDSLATHGFCVINLADRLDNAKLDAALTALSDWCKQYDADMDNHQDWLKTSGRSHDPAEWNKRYSMNHRSNWSHDAWLQIVDVLQPIFDVLIGHGTYIITHGGDNVRAYARSDQDIHADGWEERPSAADLLTPKWLVASVAVHDIVIPPGLEHDF